MTSEVSAQRSVLVTGFQPFGGDPDNPSAEVATALDGRTVRGHLCHGRVLPVATREVADLLIALIDGLRPAVVVLLGVAVGRPAVAIERVAVNVLDFPLPDRDGAQPAGGAVVPGGPDAYFSTLPVKAVLQGWRAAGIPGYLSNSAGTYLCNQVFYLAAHHAANLPVGLGVRTGLVHLPALPTQAARHQPPLPSSPLDDQLAAVTVAVQTVLDHRGPDLAFPAGALS